MDVAIFWEIASYIPYVNRRFVTTVTSTFTIENQPCKKPACGRWLVIVLPEDGGDAFLRNVGSHTDYTAIYPI
jgi:hypothetical protein